MWLLSYEVSNLIGNWPKKICTDQSVCNRSIMTGNIGIYTISTRPSAAVNQELEDEGDPR